MELTFSPIPKQAEALRHLLDEYGLDTSYLLFGGAAGGSKSVLGCFWTLLLALRHPGIRLFVGRKELKDLRATTWPSMMETAGLMGLDRRALTLNSQDSYVLVRNGNMVPSRIDLISCAYEPSDPLFGHLGSYPYASGWIEEAQEVPEMAFDTLKSRIGRCPVGNAAKLKPRILLTANPSKNFLFRMFYSPFKDGHELPGHHFIASLPGDNPHLTKEYMAALESIRDVPTRERLLHGKWEYSDDTSLVDTASLQALFTNPVAEGGTPALTVDVARFGGDRTVIWRWVGAHAMLEDAYSGKSLEWSAGHIRTLAARHNIPMSNVVIDETGVGAGLVEMLPGCVPFVANWSPSELSDGTKQNYANAKAEVSYRFAEDAKARRLKVSFPNPCDFGELTPERTRSLFEGDVAQLKSWKGDTDSKLRIMPKEEVKANLGRSPDFLDGLVMRYALPLGFDGWVPFDDDEPKDSRNPNDPFGYLG